MAVFALRSLLTVEERQLKRKLILRDVMALLSLFAITAAIAFVTYFLFNSFSRRRYELAQTWLTRGDNAIAKGQPQNAVNAYRSALEYDPGRPKTEIKLAMALSAAGRIEEAISYFNSLLETEPGNGLINLELARLAARQGDESRAVEYYQRALDGRWQGDGYERRRMVRLELAGYLIDRKDYSKARPQLLIAAGNAPDVPTIKLQIAGLMEKADDLADALEIYRNVAEEKPNPIEALEGASRVAFALGRLQLARSYLEKVISHPDFGSLPHSVQSNNHEMLAQVRQTLDLFPGTELPAKERARRILHIADLSRAQLGSCAATGPTYSASLADLTTKWQQIPAKAAPSLLAQDPQLEQTIMQLTFETEKRSAAVCGGGGGEDALLLKIAQSPSGVEQQ